MKWAIFTATFYRGGKTRLVQYTTPKSYIMGGVFSVHKWFSRSMTQFKEPEGASSLLEKE